MCGRDQLLHPPTSRNGRRRSADIGGLCLATRNGGLHGQGWLGHSDHLQYASSLPSAASSLSPAIPRTRYAELLGDMYTQTLNAANHHTTDWSVTYRPLLVSSI